MGFFADHWSNWSCIKRTQPGVGQEEVQSCPLGSHTWLHAMPQEVLPTRELPSYKGRCMENSRKFQKISPLRHTTQLPDHIPKTTQSLWVGMSLSCTYSNAPIIPA